MPKPDLSLIRVGDRLQLFVKEDRSFNQELVVRERGDLILGPFGRIPVVGLTVEGAERRTKEMLERDQLQTATVLLDRVARGKLPKELGGGDPMGEESRKILVYMTGKVNRPGQHVITLPEGAPVGVYEALLITGGMDRFGDDQKVHVLRNENNVKRKIPVNIRQIRDGKAQDPPIGHGDIVVVPEKVFGF